MDKLRQLQDGWDTLKMEVAEARAAASRAERALTDKARSLEASEKQVCALAWHQNPVCLCLYTCA